MNSKSFITSLTAAVALLGAASAFAAPLVGEADLSLPMAYSSKLSRAEVQAAALQARAAGQQFNGDYIALKEPAFMSTVTRAQVHAEALEAIRLHAIGQGEHNYFPTQEQLDSIRLAGERAVTMQVAAR